MRLSYGTVRESPRQVIYAVRVYDAILELHEVDDVAARMRERLAHRGEPSAEIVVVQGDAKETLRLFGSPYSVNRVRMRCLARQSAGRRSSSTKEQQLDRRERGRRQNNNAVFG